MFPITFYAENRSALAAQLPDGAAFVSFAGTAPRQSADAYYPFFANRNFVYLTGMEEEELILTLVREPAGLCETVYLRQPDAMKERWTGKRIHKEDVADIYGPLAVSYTEDFEPALTALLDSGHISSIWLDFDEEPGEAPNAARKLANALSARYPSLSICDAHPILSDLRTIKKPCELEAMRKAVPITKAGIEAMMRACRPGMKEYQLKAEFDYALTQHGVLTPAFPSIICSGENNFCIHYYDYTGTVHDGDMVLNDVGAWWDNECNDVSRAWPANGHFTDRQRALYQCIYNTSEHMFSIIKPGMPMRSIDELAREFCFGQLKALGLIDDFSQIRSLMWHDGAHHVGFDVHDVINYSRLTEPGMVFCVDIGVYCQEWGIGFRLEDNCLVTEAGCENLTASIPRSIEEIEAFMAAR